MTLSIFLLSIYGFASAIATLGIGQPIRALAEKIGPRWTKRWKNADGSTGEYVTTFWYALVTCPACLSYWIGQAFSLWLFSPSISLIHHAQARYLAAEVDGFMACGVSFAIHYLSVESVHAIQDAAEAMRSKRAPK